MWKAKKKENRKKKKKRENHLTPGEKGALKQFNPEPNEEGRGQGTSLEWLAASDGVGD